MGPARHLESPPGFDLVHPVVVGAAGSAGPVAAQIVDMYMVTCADGGRGAPDDLTVFSDQVAHCDIALCEFVAQTDRLAQQHRVRAIPASTCRSTTARRTRSKNGLPRAAATWGSCHVRLRWSGSSLGRCSRCRCRLPPKPVRYKRHERLGGCSKELKRSRGRPSAKNRHSGRPASDLTYG